MELPNRIRASVSDRVGTFLGYTTTLMHSSQGTLGCDLVAFNQRTTSLLVGFLNYHHLATVTLVL